VCGPVPRSEAPNGPRVNVCKAEDAIDERPEDAAGAAADESTDAAKSAGGAMKKAGDQVKDAGE
jgi:hypothetical protein